MTDPVLPKLALAALTQAVKNGVDRIMKKHPTATRAPPYADLEAALAHHLRFVSSWCSRVHIFGMANPQDMTLSTIGISIVDMPRRFRSGPLARELFTEGELLKGVGNIALLGDPGAGKTTTIRRLVHRLLFDSPSDEGWAYPVVLVLRDHDWSTTSLVEALARALGFDPTGTPNWADQGLTTERMLAEFLGGGRSSFWTASMRCQSPTDRPLSGTS